MMGNTCHNPYFNRWFSAIRFLKLLNFYKVRHNPYFNRWFSAIEARKEAEAEERVTILILIDGFLQYLYNTNYK